MGNKRKQRKTSKTEPHNFYYNFCSNTSSSIYQFYFAANVYLLDR